MIAIYRVLTNILYPILILIIYLRKLKKKEDPLRYKEKIFVSFFKVKRKSDKKLIWFHAASVGEFKSILPVLERLNDENDNLEFLITTNTLSSSNLAQEELKKFDNTYHRFFPIYVNFITKKFISNWKPNFVFLVDSEIWPNLILNLKNNKIPLAIINARITKKTFSKWILVPQTAKKIFNCFDLCLTSNIETKEFLTKLSVKNTYSFGNLKLINNNSFKRISL